jgi:hypothetical protein
MSKLVELRKVSNIDTVKNKAYKLGLNEVHPSSRKDKKYMVFDGNKMIHFGQMGYQDATFHGDKDRVKRFKSRNRKWQSAPKYSPAWLSWYLLW